MTQINEPNMELVVSIPTHNSAESLREVLGSVAKVGGTVLDLSAQPRGDTVTAGLSDHEKWLLLHDEISQAYPTINRAMFDRFVGLRATLSPAWATRTWNGAMELMLSVTDVNRQDFYRFTDQDRIQMAKVRKGIRKFESGDNYLHGIGEKGWDVLAALNNIGAESIDEIVLPWDSGLHPVIRNWSNNSVRRREAVTNLKDRYTDLRGQGVLKLSDMSVKLVEP